MNILYFHVQLVLLCRATASSKLIEGSQSAVSAQPLPRLLLVEDHTGFANATAEFLRLSGMDVQVAECGDRALRIATAFRPQIVLCDLSLPDMSGLDVVRQLRANPVTQIAVFAICTAMGEADIDLFKETFANDVDMFFSKPITASKVHELFRHLHRVVAT
jgi:CheY-like chemotaxis protein